MTLARRDDVGDLARRAQATADQALAPATRRAYAADWRDFVAWCASLGMHAGPPVAGEIVALYLQELFEHGSYLTRPREPAQLSTITRKLAAITQANLAVGADTPRASPACRLVLKGIRRQCAELGRRPVQKAALVLEQLRTTSEKMATQRKFRESAILRDRALLVFGWAGAFRRSELAALELADLEKRAEGYVVTVRRSKGDQFGAGQKKALPYGSHPLTCPVRTIDAWIAIAKIESGRLFRSIGNGGHIGESLSPLGVANIIKRHVKKAGLNPKDYAGHSLRAGFCTTAARAGKAPRSIMAQTGHRSVEMVFRYVREAELFDENAAMGIGL